MKKYANQYMFDRISSRMAKEFGTIKTGHEEEYAFMLYPMEGNLLKLHRMDPLRNGRRAIEAIRMCLLKVDGYINGIEYEFDNFINDENKGFLEGLLASFDPFTNEMIHNTVKEIRDLKSSDELKIYFELPVKCLLRVEKSVELWTKNLGVNGYFMFIEKQIGQQVKHDEKMNFTIFVGDKDDMVKLGIDISKIEQEYDKEVQDVK